jgi:hypothetical protein
MGWPAELEEGSLPSCFGGSRQDEDEGHNEDDANNDKR